MLKKIFFISLVICLLVGGFTIYRRMYANGISVEPAVESEKVEVEKTPIKHTPVAKPTIAHADTEDIPRDKENLIDIEKFDQEMDAIEERWQNQMLEVFVNDLKLTNSEFEEYKVMRTGFEDDRYDAYQKYHEENLKKKDSYPITNENDANDKIIEEYRELFKKRFGEEAFGRYMKKLDEFNSDLRKSRGQDEGILTIDF